MMDIMEREMENGVLPEEIAFVSFTKKSAAEAIDRVKHRFRLNESNFPHIRTIHSMAYKSLGVRKDELMSEKDYLELGEYLGLEFSAKGSGMEEGIPSETFTGDRYMFIDGFARSRRLTPEKAWRVLGDYDINWLEYERFHRALTEYKRERNLMDFSDLLEQDHEPLPIKVAIIDEAQDLSTLQWEFCMKIFRNAERIYITGDDDQAIYTWSGADVRYFLNIPGDRIVLHQSYRVPNAVHALAQDLSSRISNRMPKKYAPTPEEGSVEYHSNLDNVDFGEGTWLLLARNAYMLNRLAAVMRQQGYVYAFRDTSVIKAEHISAITLWERWRAAGVLSVEDTLKVQRWLPDGVTQWPNVIWHKALTKIPHHDREFYISLLRRGEKITQKPRINISTIHGVKGGEADNVLLLQDTTLRTFDAWHAKPDAEHRVWYVGVTRAKKNLHIVSPQTKLFYTI